jgi:hypothetical protein
MADLRDLVADAIDRADRQLADRPETSYLFGDIPVVLRLAPEGRMPALGGMIAARSAPPSEDRWTIRVVGGMPDAYGALLPEAGRLDRSVLRSTGDLYYLWLDEAGGYVTAIDRRRRRGLLWFTDPERIASWHVARPFLHAFKGLTLDTPWVPLHAAGIARGGHGVVVVGMSGAGKTSIALAAAMSGWDYLGDDAILIRPGPPTAASLYSSCRVRTDMFDIFRDAMTASLGTSDDAGEIKAELDLARIGACGAGTARVAAILVPDRRGAAVPTITPIGRSETVRKLAFAARQSIQGDEASAFDKIVAFVRDVPCHGFDPGPDPFAAARALEVLLPRETAA